FKSRARRSQQVSSPSYLERNSSLSSATRNSCIAPMTYGWELNVPRAKHTSAGRSSRKRFMRSRRQHTTERLAVRDHVRTHTEVFLRAACRQAESHEHLVEDQDDAACSAYLAD